MKALVVNALTGSNRDHFLQANLSLLIAVEAYASRPA